MNNNRYKVKITDTETGEVIADLRAAAFCGAVGTSICDGLGYGIKQLGVLGGDNLLVKHMRKCAKKSVKMLKKREKALRVEREKEKINVSR